MYCHCTFEHIIRQRSPSYLGLLLLVYHYLLGNRQHLFRLRFWYDCQYEFVYGNDNAMVDVPSNLALRCG